MVLGALTYPTQRMKPWDPTNRPPRVRGDISLWYKGVITLTIPIPTTPMRNLPTRNMAICTEAAWMMPAMMHNTAVI